MNLDNPNFRSVTRKKQVICDLIAELYDLPVEAIQPEFLDFYQIVAIGAKKYAMNNWLEPNGKCSSEKDMHDSMFHHLAHSKQEGKMVLENDVEYNWVQDKESHLDPLLHLACRALMLYTRRQRGIIHPEDRQ